jgi:7-carboxy-7-deazaguanine synthase
MNIVEIFYSLQGEGRLAGVPSVFIRVAGCPLRCKWCDSKYAQDPSSGEDLSVEEIINRMTSLLPAHGSEIKNFVVVTGGEPMTNQHLPLLLTSLARAGCHITVETAGIAFIPSLPVDLMSISPKLSNAQIGISEKPPIRHLQQLINSYDCQLKFVIDSESDIDEIKAVANSLKNIDPQKIMLMPQAKTREQLLTKSPMVAKLCAENGFTFCQRLHILLWDDQRGR